MKLGAALVFALATFPSSCSLTETWTGWVYPDAPNLLVSRKIGPFDSVEECRAAAQLIGKQLTQDNGKQFDYECGKNCKPDGGSMGLNVCEETVK